MSRDDLENYLTVTQAARLKGVSRQTVYAAIEDKRLPHATKLGRTVVKRADVLAWDLSLSKPGRKKGQPVSELHRARISEGIKANWQRRKSSSTTNKSDKH